MKLTGRFVALVIAVAVTAVVHIYIRQTYGVVDWMVANSLAVLTPLGWFLGKCFDTAKWLSLKDALTDVYNRRFIEDVFPKLVRLSVRKGVKLIVFIADVDNFKSINDSHGHSAGDSMLRHLSSALVEVVGKSGWGGDEFLVIMPCVDEIEGENLRLRLNKVFGEQQGRKPMPENVSMGYAIYPYEGTELDELLRVADKRMYARKLHRG